jgi:hypothetical protein
LQFAPPTPPLQDEQTSGAIQVAFPLQTLESLDNFP